MYNIEKLSEMEETLQDYLKDNLLRIMTELNRKQQLDDFLKMIGVYDQFSSAPRFEPFKNGKILVFGDSEIRAKDFLMTVAKEGFDKDRFELHLNYEDAKTYPFQRLQYSTKHTAVLFGPIGHSGIAKENFGSVISALESQDGYPYIIRVGTGSSELKITKSSLKAALDQLKRKISTTN